VLSIVLLGPVLVLQLSVLNRLTLPGGAVPDLVLIGVAALAMVNGPVRGMVTGFAAGLCIDLAPPGSAVIGEYALVLCLVGWAAGSLSGLVAKSAVRSLVLLACVVALGEVLAAALGVALNAGQESWSAIGPVVPAAVGYDLLLLPFVLYLAVLASPAAARQGAGRRERSALTAAAGNGRAGKKPQQREPRLGQGVARPHDGWVGRGPAGGSRPHRRPAVPHGLRPARGVAGSAISGPARHPGLAAPAISLNLAGRARRDGAIASTLGSGLGHHPGRHPGLPVTGRISFRPHAGVPGGSAAGQSAALLRPGWRRPVTVRFGARRGDASVDRLLGLSRGSLGPARSRRKAAPRFRRAATGVSSMPAAGGTLDARAVLSARRRSAATPRLRLAAGRRGDARLGGSAHRLRTSVRPPARPRFRPRPAAAPHARRSKQPSFGYGRHSVLSYLTGRRIGGRWLASTRAGTRSGVWLIGKKTGGVH
jgi:rod shape-determining protein MreD